MGHIEGPTPRQIDSDTLFCICSVSKTVTALAVLLAVQDALLDLDTPLAEYMPDLSINSRHEERPETKITLRHFLSHWTGPAEERPQGNSFNDSGYFQRHLDRISHTWLRFPVGYRSQYSNMGVDPAGYLVQVRSGFPFARFAKVYDFEPLGITCDSGDV